MATLAQIKQRILTKYQSLPTQREKLEFLYQVQERLRNVHNTQGGRLVAGDITEAQWDNFKTQWLDVAEKVTDRIARLRDKVFTEDYGLQTPTSPEDETRSLLWGQKREQLKSDQTLKNDIDTIWQ